MRPTLSWPLKADGLKNNPAQGVVANLGFRESAPPLRHTQTRTRCNPMLLSSLSLSGFGHGDAHHGKNRYSKQENAPGEKCDQECSKTSYTGNSCNNHECRNGCISHSRPAQSTGGHIVSTEWQCCYRSDRFLLIAALLKLARWRRTLSWGGTYDWPSRKPLGSRDRHNWFPPMSRRGRKVSILGLAETSTGTARHAPS